MIVTTRYVVISTASSMDGRRLTDSLESDFGAVPRGWRCREAAKEGPRNVALLRSLA